MHTRRSKSEGGEGIPNLRQNLSSLVKHLLIREAHHAVAHSFEHDRPLRIALNLLLMNRPINLDNQVML